MGLINLDFYSENIDNCLWLYIFTMIHSYTLHFHDETSQVVQEKKCLLHSLWYLRSFSRMQLLWWMLHFPSIRYHRAESIMTNSAEGDRDSRTSPDYDQKKMLCSDNLHQATSNYIENKSHTKCHLMTKCSHYHRVDVSERRERLQLKAI